MAQKNQVTQIARGRFVFRGRSGTIEVFESCASIQSRKKEGSIVPSGTGHRLNASPTTKVVGYFHCVPPGQLSVSRLLDLAMETRFPEF